MAITPVDDEARVLDLCEQLLAEAPPADTPSTEFLGRQFDLGLAWVHFPEGHGGLGLSPKLQKTVNETLARAKAPRAGGLNPIGHGMGAPDDRHPRQRRAEARATCGPLFTNEEIWCQLFSEPGAGSDVAGLSSRAVRDGDEWIVNGQKVWTTLAHMSRWGMLVARTDPDAPKHKGLTYFVVDMHAPGVEVRPLYQITGEAEFNEVYFTDVRIPDAERLGEVGEGWRVSLTTLMNERVSIGGQIPPRGSGFAGELMKTYAAHRPARRRHPRPGDAAVDPGRGAAAHQHPGQPEPRRRARPGPRARSASWPWPSCTRTSARAPSTCWARRACCSRPATRWPGPRRPRCGRSPQQAFLRSRANSIEGGTTEIMKNILGERVLGLPGDVRTDKDRPWIEVPRS